MGQIGMHNGGVSASARQGGLLHRHTRLPELTNPSAAET